jgi:hypothetical protein
VQLAQSTVLPARLVHLASTLGLQTTRRGDRDIRDENQHQLPCLRLVSSWVEQDLCWWQPQAELRPASVGASMNGMDDKLSEETPRLIPIDGVSGTDRLSHVNRYRLAQRPYSVPVVTGDVAAQEDTLGFMPYSRALGDLIASERTSTPLTIGVIGAWGSGKTTLLEFVKQQLGRIEPAPPGDRGGAFATLDVTAIRFDVWHHEATSAVYPALAYRILAEVRLGARTRVSMLFHRVWRRLRREARVSMPDLALRATLALSLALVAFGMSAKLGSGLPQWAAVLLGSGAVLATLRGLWSNPVVRLAGSLARHPAYGEPSEEYLEILKDLEVVDRRLAATKQRIALLIDDVDRCTPAKAVATLQAVNLLASHRSFVTVLAYDAGILVKLIEEHFKWDSSAGVSGAAFLDKVISVPFCIPTPSVSDVEGFLSAIVAPERLRVDLIVDQPNIRLDATPLSEDEMVTAESDAWDRLAIVLRPNPRHLRRLVNIYRLTVALAQQDNNWRVAAQPWVTIGWLVMCVQWPRAAAWLARMLTPFGVEAHRDIQETMKGEPYERLLEVLDSPEMAARFGLDNLVELKALRDLLRRPESSPRTEDLQALRRFTIAFSPEVLAELEQPWVYLPPPTVIATQGTVPGEPESRQS